MRAADTDQLRDAAATMTGAYRRLVAARLSDNPNHQIRAWDACTLAADALDDVIARLPLPVEEPAATVATCRCGHTVDQHADDGTGCQVCSCVDRPAFVLAWHAATDGGRA